MFSNQEPPTPQLAQLAVLYTLLEQARQELQCDWAALAMARLIDGDLRTDWLHVTGHGVGAPLSVDELLDRTPRHIHLKPASNEASSAPPLDGWLQPLPLAPAFDRLRRTATLITSHSIEGEPPQPVRQLGELMAAYERTYIAELLLAAVEQGPDPIELSDRSARLLYVNAAWRHYFEYDDTHIVGHSPGDLVRDLSNPVHDPAYVRFTYSELTKHHIWLGTMGSRNRSGERRFNEVHVSPFGVATDRHDGNLAVRRDLSHRDARDAALATAHREFRAVLAAMPDAVVVVREEVVYFANLAFAQLVDSDVEGVIGKHFSSFLHAEDGPSFSSWDAGEMRSVRFCQPSGATRVVEVSVAGNVSFEGSPSRILLARDVTERILSREQLVRTQRLAALGAMAAGLAHEINNPLAYLMLNLEAAREHALPGGEPLEEALDGARRIRTIVSELKGFWSDEGHEIGSVDVATALSSAVNLAQLDLRQKIEIVRQVEPNLSVRARQGQLVQIMLNLVLNAARAIEDGEAAEPRIRISAVGASADAVHLTVSDTGASVSPERRACLFDPSASLSASGVGPTFGLALSKRMLDELGGSIALTSTGPTGNTFTVRLPRVEKEETTLETPSSQPELSPTPYRVLVVDDEPLIARAIKRALAPFIVHIANDGEEALATLANHTFDAILCDLMMPRISGADLYAHIERNLPHLLNRIVFMTGGAFSEWSQQFLESVNCPVLEKPFQPLQLRECIESVAKKTRRNR